MPAMPVMLAEHLYNIGLRLIFAACSSSRLWNKLSAAFCLFSTNNPLFSRSILTLRTEILRLLWGIVFLSRSFHYHVISMSSSAATCSFLIQKVVSVGCVVCISSIVVLCVCSEWVPLPAISSRALSPLTIYLHLSINKHNGRWLLLAAGLYL